MRCGDGLVVRAQAARFLTLRVRCWVVVCAYYCCDFGFGF